jgi:hypothetical protein
VPLERIDVRGPEPPERRQPGLDLEQRFRLQPVETALRVHGGLHEPGLAELQNAEHLADHYHPRFKIPRREERETMRVGQAVDLYVYGPRTDGKQDTVKVRISEASGDRPNVRYQALVETPLAETHLADGTTVIEFGPEHIASVYMTSRPGARKPAAKNPSR